MHVCVCACVCACEGERDEIWLNTFMIYGHVLVLICFFVNVTFFYRYPVMTKV